MPISGQPLQGLCYIAWNTAAESGKTGDAANHTLRLIRDGVELVPTGIPSEVDSTNCPGLYQINLAAAEMTATTVVLAGKSSSANVIIIPVQLSVNQAITEAYATVITNSLQIWADQQIEAWETDAIGQIATDVQCIYARECVPTTAGVSVITLPSYVREVRRVTWRGYTLECVNWEEMQLLNPATCFASPNNPANVESSRSRPWWYAMHPTNPWDIRLYPTPSESFTNLGEPNPYAPQPNTPSCIVDYFREPDVTGTNPVISLPPYIFRRTQKAYVLFKAFGAEGKGQDLRAASYYRKKYLMLIDKFRLINSGAFVGKKYQLGEEGVFPEAQRWPKPFLPSNFERIVFK